MALMGPNGSGKSTLCRLALGLLQPGRGRVRRPAGGAGAGYVSQRPEEQVIGATVEEELLFGPRLSGAPVDWAASRMHAVLEAVGLDLEPDRPTSTLSGGQLQLLAVAAALMGEPELLVVDEATSMCDGSTAQALWGAVRGWSTRRRAAVLWVTHRPEEALWADRLILLEAGRVAADGPPAETFAGQYGARVALPELLRLARAVEGMGGPQGLWPAEAEEAARRLCPQKASGPS